MNNKEKSILMELLERYPNLEPCTRSITDAADALIGCYEKKGKVLICGNGGSAADAEHITGELMKGFMKKRPIPPDLAKKLQNIHSEKGSLLSKKLQQALPAIALTGHISLSTAFANDVDSSCVFAQQVLGYGLPGDILLGLSTSGSSANVVHALITAQALGLRTIGMTGAAGGSMKGFCEILISVPETSTPRVQELHLPVYHALCRIAEEHFFSE